MTRPIGDRLAAHVAVELALREAERWRQTTELAVLDLQRLAAEYEQAQRDARRVHAMWTHWLTIAEDGLRVVIQDRGEVDAELAQLARAGRSAA